MAAQLSHVPARSVLGLLTGGMLRVSEDWRRWFQQVKDRIDATTPVIGSVLALTAQAASVAGSVETPTLEAGLYRVSWSVRVTQAATTSSSVAVTIGATVGGVPTTQVGDALTANTVGAVQSGSVLVEADAATAITYATTYASVGATAMAYGLRVSVERVA